MSHFHRSSVAQENEHTLMLVQSGILTSQSSIMIVLCGIPGSGKGTFAHAFCSAMPPGKWASFNQDALGSRQNVMNAAGRGLTMGQSVIIDRCNFDEPQRATWLQLSDQCGADAVICLLVENYNNLRVATQRAYKRGADGLHEAHTNWKKVCGAMSSSFTYPSLHEGFTAIYQCRNASETRQFIDVFSSLYSFDESAFAESQDGDVAPPTPAAGTDVILAFGEEDRQYQQQQQQQQQSEEYQSPTRHAASTLANGATSANGYTEEEESITPPAAFADGGGPDCTNAAATTICTSSGDEDEEWVVVKERANGYYQT